MVGADGTVARGNSAKVGHGGTGNYLVDFSVDIPACTFIAAIGSTDTSVPSAGTITLAPGAGNKNVVVVATFDGSGDPADQPFHLIVNCRSATDGPSAAGAIAADGTVTRNLGISSASHTGTGTYTVTTNVSNMSGNCTFPATIGTGGTAVQTPGMVSVASGGGSVIDVYTFDVEGNPSDRGFQFYAECLN